MVETTPNPRPRIAVVTGANRGLGYALASKLAHQGLTVVLTARRLSDAEAAVATLMDDNVHVRPGELDIVAPASVNRLFSDIEREYGRLDVLINNAAIAIDRGQKPSQADIETVAATLDVNVLGTWRCCKQAVRLMRKGGYGRITNVSSHMGSLAGTHDPGSAAYRVSKTAVNELTRIFAAETRGENILVNSASPGTVETRMSYGTSRYTAAEAAEEMLWLSLLPDDGPTGGFFHGRETLDW
ncbi:SDR family NAD(P)-dependent oxidoreductase [Streptomyces sp. NBC_00138]|uniref:SDR family NAD(P)-dependent oxidoreductase n=1 Tax=Streptomyces sp. NBC_00138 TaxID=2903625 RepID=UPI00324B9A07